MMGEIAHALLRLGILALVATVPQKIHEQLTLSEVMVKERERKHVMITILSTEMDEAVRVKLRQVTFELVVIHQPQIHALKSVATV
jgi:acid stress-induced BolA-like protein IbaG/YrbA